MKQVLKTLKKSQKKITEKVEQRDAVSLKRSVQWHDSKSGETFEKKTGTLADAYDGLSEAILQIEVYLND